MYKKVCTLGKVHLSALSAPPPKAVQICEMSQTQVGSAHGILQKIALTALTARMRATEMNGSPAQKAHLC